MWGFLSCWVGCSGLQGPGLSHPVVPPPAAVGRCVTDKEKGACELPRGCIPTAPPPGATTSPRNVPTDSPCDCSGLRHHAEGSIKYPRGFLPPVSSWHPRYGLRLLHEGLIAAWMTSIDCGPLSHSVEAPTWPCVSPQEDSGQQRGQGQPSDCSTTPSGTCRLERISKGFHDRGPWAGQQQQQTSCVFPLPQADGAVDTDHQPPVFQGLSPSLWPACK